jgi:methyl-accepting chemotaxis protein
MGRGFSVVAEEVRKLAVASGESVKSISQSLQTIQQAIADLSQRINQIDENVSGQTGAIQEMANASQALAIMANELLESSKNIYQLTE